MASQIQYNPALMPKRSNLLLLNPETRVPAIHANKLLFNAELRISALALVLIPIAAFILGTFLSHGIPAFLSAVCGLAFLGISIRKLCEEWRILHNKTEHEKSLSGYQIVRGEVDSLQTRRDGQGGCCNIAKYHFLSQEGDFRTGMYLSTSKLPEAGASILIAYDGADPKRIRVIDNFQFYKFPIAGMTSSYKNLNNLSTSN